MTYRSTVLTHYYAVDLYYRIRFECRSKDTKLCFIALEVYTVFLFIGVKYNILSVNSKVFEHIVPDRGNTSVLVYFKLGDSGVGILSTLFIGSYLVEYYLDVSYILC